MGSRNLALCTKRTLVSGHTAAGNGTITSTILDMSGFKSVTFDVLIGTLTSGQTPNLGVLQIQGGNQAGGGDMANLVGAALTVPDAAASGGVTIEVALASVRYLQVVFTRNSQAAELLGIVATQNHDAEAAEQQDITTWPATVVAVSPQYSQSYLTTTSVTPLRASNTTVVNTGRTGTA